MNKNKLKMHYLIVLFFLWSALVSLFSYLVTNNLLPLGVVEIIDSIGSKVPSIYRLKDNYIFGGYAARRIAAMSLMATPILIAFLFFIDVEPTVSGVRDKKKETKVAAILIVVWFFVFISGFGANGPGRMFYKDAVAFSILSSFITYISSLSLRVAFCLKFIK